MALSQSALKHRVGAVEVRDVVDALDVVQRAIKSVPVLDARLADYVFFPLSIILSEVENVPPKAIRLAVACLDHLISRGWGSGVRVDLCKQLFSLLNLLLIREQPDSEDQDSLISVLNCLASFFNAAGEPLSQLYREESEGIVPIAGQVLGSILTALSESQIPKTQLAASNTVCAMITSINNRHILRGFLPGIISHFTKILQAGTRHRRPYRVLVACLQGTAQALSKTVGGHSQSAVASSTAKKQVLDSWEKASSIQLKQALANIVTLRYHEKFEVIKALFSLCATVLEDCREVLDNCCDLILETALVICSQHPRDITSVRSHLLRIVAKDKSLSRGMRAHLSNWLSSLPRIFESRDEQVQKRNISKICTAYMILAGLEEDMSSLHEDITTSLKDSATTIFRIHKHHSLGVDQIETVEAPMALVTQSLSRTRLQFDPIISSQGRDHESLISLRDFLKLVTQSRTWKGLQNRFVVCLAGALPEQLVGSSWLLSQIIELESAQSLGSDDFISFDEDDEHSGGYMPDFALVRASNILCNATREDERDWRLEAIALEIIAYEAKRRAKHFRSELLDLLFPVVERMGSRNLMLRKHAMTCLDVISTACGYSSSGELIVQNVDYMVNSVALKFGTYEISPEAPRVLILMLELSGASLLPYLDDLVDSIFSILDSFHAYPKLVESLFSVLKLMVNLDRQSASKAPCVSVMHRQRASWRPLDTIDVINAIKSVRDHSNDTEPTPESLLNHDIDRDEIGDVLTEAKDTRVAPSGDARESTYASQGKSYKMILSVVRLAQHYLTQESPYLRQQLLQLVGAGCDNLWRSEDDYLPLINDIWPPVIRRLYDEEAIVSLAAMDTLASIFRTAGDFVATRVEDEWQDIGELYHRLSSRMHRDEGCKGPRRNFTYTYKLWDGMVKMLLSILATVRISPEMEDDIFDMLGPLISTRSDIRDALVLINPDGVWFLEEGRRYQHPGFSVDGFDLKAIVP